jgi:hypothetical protein
MAAHGAVGPTFAASRPAPSRSSVSSQLAGYLG